MKIVKILPLLLLLAQTSAKAQVGPNITSWLQNTTATGYGGYVSNVQLVQYSANYVYISTNCIPAYAIGPWPSNPNLPSPQNFVCEFPRNPVQNTGAAVYTPMGSIGLWSNGVSIFNSEDGFHWNAATSAWAQGPATFTTGWNRNAALFEGISFDSCLGHPQQQGDYHNHVNPRCLYNDLDSTHHSPIIGFAFDGFPIYGAYGYASATAHSGAVKRMRSGYILNPDTTRSGGPHPISTYPMGDCCEDYIYSATAGDLDAHNGRFCYTPDYPNGTYAYFVTIDSLLNPVYPFVIGPTYYGVVGSTNTHITPVGPDTTYSSTTGISNVNRPQIKYKLAPNPVEDHLYIYMDAANANNVAMSLVTLNGQTVKVLYDLQPSIAYALDISDLPAGMYILTFSAGDTKIAERIIKTK